jgi:hypothetical protein
MAFDIPCRWFADYWLELVKDVVPQNHRPFGEEPHNSYSRVTTVLFLFFISICCRGQSLFRQSELIVGGRGKQPARFHFLRLPILWEFLRLDSGHLLEN